MPPDMVPWVLIAMVADGLFAAERLAPGRTLPESRGWYARTAFLNLAQLGIVLLAGYTWSVWLNGPSIFDLHRLPVVLQGFIAWLVGTFVFYRWHRARHASDFLWRALHQIHHSASRIETLTAFYKHPLEIMFNSVLAALIVFPLLGAAPEASAWYSVFAALGEFYYHMNIRTPRWTGYFLQRPEHHSIHHQLGVHHYNYGDITWWDRLFGTFRDADKFSAACGYEGNREQRIFAMLAFRDVNK